MFDSFIEITHRNVRIFLVAIIGSVYFYFSQILFNNLRIITSTREKKHESNFGQQNLISNLV